MPTDVVVMFAGLSGCKLVLVLALSSVRGVAVLAKESAFTLSLSLALTGLAPCRLTKMPSTHDSHGIRRKSPRKSLPLTAKCLSMSFMPLRSYIHCHC